MRSTLIASIPALVVFFGLAFGFVTFHLMAQNAEATGAECNYLDIIVDRKETTRQMCAGVITQSGVEMHENDACRFVANITADADNPLITFIYVSTYRGSCSLSE